jgi:hypothetical protein
MNEHAQITRANKRRCSKSNMRVGRIIKNCPFFLFLGGDIAATRQRFETKEYLKEKPLSQVVL